MLHRTLIVGLLLLTMPLLGCLGGGDAGLEPTDLPEANQTPPPPTGATLHRGGTANTSADELDGTTDELLAPGVPLPTGVTRLTGFGAFEPTLGVTSQGDLFMSTTDGETATGFISIIRSTDHGESWEDVTPKLAGTLSAPPTTFDPLVHVDQATDRVYNLDMEGLSCNWIKWSDDGGETWTHNPLGCGQPPVLDHPSLFTGPPRTVETVGYDNVVYLCVNRIADSACATSLDGGVTWLGFNPVFPGVNTEGELCGGLHGHGVTGPDGRAYLGKNQCGTPSVAVTLDDGITWETYPVSSEVPAKRHDVELAVDDAGTVYALWISDDDLPYLAHSTDNGQTWSDPIMVAKPGLNTTTFPTLAAGAADRIALVYLGTTSDEDIRAMGTNDTWHAYLSTIVNATDQDPVIAAAPVDPLDDPIARGPCDDDNRCDGIGDFIDIVIDADGRPWAALVDVCNEACVGGDQNDEALGKVATLAQGPSLIGELAPLPSIPGLEEPGTLPGNATEDQDGNTTGEPSGNQSGNATLGEGRLGTDQRAPG